MTYRADFLDIAAQPPAERKAALERMDATDRRAYLQWRNRQLLREKRQKKEKIPCQP